jgi:hypothetical protein
MDGDGMPNTWEADNELDASNAADGATDADVDHISNKDEFLSGTDPQDESSYLHVTLMRSAAGGGVEVHWSSVTGKSYTIDWATNFLDDLQFNGLESNIPGGAVTTSYTDTNPSPRSMLFYRATVQ